ncbi:LD-carboxypeptidase, partial [Acinetobacter baumannii]
YDFDSMVAHLRERLPMPVLTGLPFGHIRDKITIPVGATVALKSTPRGYSLNFSNYPYLD